MLPAHYFMQYWGLRGPATLLKAACELASTWSKLSRCKVHARASATQKSDAPTADVPTE